MIKHVSFDVWNTLITANPLFAAARTEYIANCTGLPVAQVKKAYTATKSYVDGLAEFEGIGLTTEHVYALLFDHLGVFADITKVRTDIDALFLQLPPAIDPGVRDLLKYLYNHIVGDRCITVSISSNSNFISGNVMMPFLQQSLGRRFLHGDFSDLLQTAKPSKKFFTNVAMGVDMAHGGDGVKYEVAPYEILHVGDNPICDGRGPTTAGIHSLLISGPEEIFDRVKDRIESENVHGMSYDVNLMYPHRLSMVSLHKLSKRAA